LPGDASAEYKLTPEGTFALGFTVVTSYDILDGQIV